MITAKAMRILTWIQALGWGATLRNIAAIAFTRGDRVLTVPGVAGKIRVRSNDSDLVMFEQVFVNQDYEFDLGFGPATIVDAGANAGYASLFFHRKYPNARIVTIEPDSENYEAIRINTCDIPQIQPVKGGLWSHRQPLIITDADAPKCMISLKPAGKAGPDTIEGYGVGDVMRMLGVDVIDLLKIDIEGGELELFSENCHPWISRVRVFMVELHDRMRPGCAIAFYSAIRHLRFSQFQKGDIVMIVNEELRPK